MNPAIQAILFDLDGTLIDTEPTAARAVEECFARWGVTLDGHDAEYVTGRTWQSALAFLLRKYRPQMTSEISDTEAAHEIMEYYRVVLENDLLEVPGATQAVRALSSHYPLAVVSGSSRRDIEWTTKKLGIFDCFRFILGAEDYAHGKPDPEPYLAALKILGLPAAQTLVFEDSLAGIAAARAAGTIVVAITSTNHFSQDTTAAHHHVRDLKGIDAAWIQNLTLCIRN